MLTLLLTIVTAAWAVPAKKCWRTMTQPDGTSVELMLLGDENQGLALVNPQFFLAFAEAMRHGKD